ncbi:hypothetical protein, partial [Lentilactobacillus hilgardii]
MRKLDTIEGALAEASNGRHVFLENGQDKMAFALANGGLPSYEIIFVKDAGIVQEKDGKKVFI